jgi:cysteine desulfurase
MDTIRIRRIYLDWNATAPPLDAALDAMQDAARDAWGNPASVHANGRAARARVEDARAAVAELAGADPRDVVLTSGGTEANNIALRSAFEGKRAADGAVLVTSRLEHPSVTRVAEALEREGVARVRWIAVRPDGQIDLDDLELAMGEGGVVLVALQAVSSETGVIAPMVRIIELARAMGARVHVDAVQAWGKIDELASAADTRSLAAHKFRGPKGIGALIARPGLRLSPVLLGGSQERGLRPGTVDPIAAAGLATAARHAASGPARYRVVAPLRDHLEAALVGMGALVNGAGAPRVPHVANLAWPAWRGPELVAALDLLGVSVSSGTACSAGTNEPSPALKAMLGHARAASSMRVSIGETTTGEEIDRAVEAFARVVVRIPGGTGARD